MRCLGKRLLREARITAQNFTDQIASQLLMDHRRAVIKGARRGAEGGKRLVFDLDGVECIEDLIPGFGDNRGDDIAYVVNFLCGECGPQHLPHRPAIG